MNAELKYRLLFYRDAVINSYAQMFFSNNRIFAVLLLLASFVDPYTGAAGLIALLVAISAARWVKFDSNFTRSGAYTYCSLMLGLAMGVYYHFNAQFFLILVLMSLFTLFITVWMANITLRSNTPFLSLPFILAVWLVLLSTRSYAAIGLSERGIYTINELWAYGGPGLVEFYQSVNNLPIPPLLDVYLKSLGAIYFQYNIIAGVLIAIGLLAYSRIAFLLSVTGFLTGYFFYHFLEGGLSELVYSYIGFNFILSAIAIGGFFLIPSARSFLLVIISTPLIAILISALGALTAVYQLPLFSLPFTLMAMLLLFVLRLRSEPSRLELVTLQQYSPEKNLYKHINRKERFQHDTYFHIYPPYYGEWLISQGHNGNKTHREDWKYAWDFVVTDDTLKTFRLPGTEVSDFYCYNLPVLAPAAGYISEVLDDIDDNPIGEVNLEHNWGNTVVIKHGEYLYSKLSHLKKSSIRVKPGDYVKRGEMLGTCGNSGRSPEPHIHFQLQATPYIGSKTLLYPISYYISNDDGQYHFHAFEYPAEGQKISKVNNTSLLKEAFNFIPGELLHFEWENNKGQKEILKWEVFVDAWNNPYLYCHNSNSTAWFVNNDTLHYFTDFQGDRHSLLYYFYLAAHKILLGYYEQLSLSDRLPIEGFYNGPLKHLQDFIAPFKIFLRADYRMQFSRVDEPVHPTEIEIQSSVEARIGNSVKRSLSFNLLIKNKRIEKIIITENKQRREATCIG